MTPKRLALFGVLGFLFLLLLWVWMRGGPQVQAGKSPNHIIAQFQASAPDFSERKHALYAWDVPRDVSTSTLHLPVLFRGYVARFPDACEVEPNDYFNQANGPLHSGHSFCGYPDDTDDFFFFRSAAGTIGTEMVEYAGQGGQLLLYHIDDLVTPVVQVWKEPYRFSYEGPAGLYFLRIFTERGFSQQQPYTLLVHYPIPSTPTPVPTATPTPSSSSTPLPTRTPTPTATAAGTPTPTFSPTDTPISTLSPTPRMLEVTFVTNYPCRGREGNREIRVKAYVTDVGGDPVDDAAVTVEIVGGETTTLVSLGGGYYGGLGGDCWSSSSSYHDDRDVTVTATKAGYTGGIVTANTGVNPSCQTCP